MQKHSGAEDAGHNLHDDLFEEIVTAHWEPINSLAFRLTGDSQEAEDLALETFIRLWRQSPGLSESVSGWLYRVALRLGFNALRAAQRRREYEWKAGRDAFDNSKPFDPPEQFERLEEQKRVRNVLAQLEERQAKILVLRSSGLAYREIAEILNLNPASIGTLLIRAEHDFEKVYKNGG